MLRDREEVISSGAGLAKLNIGDFPLMRMASDLPVIPPGFTVILHMVRERSQRDTKPSHSARSIATGSIRTARIAAGTAARNAAAKRIRDGSASMLTSVAFT